MPYKILIVDDEHLSRDLIKEYLNHYSNVEIIGESDNGFDAFRQIQQLKPDLVFLDVQMPKLNGFEMLELLENPPAIIFCTAFHEHAIQAFEANAIDYLLKPLAKSRFDKAIQKFFANQTLNNQLNFQDSSVLPKQEMRFAVKRNDKIYVIPFDEIQHLEAYGDYVKIFTASDVYTKKMTFNDAEIALKNAGFIKVHRSFIVNINQIKNIQPYEKDMYKLFLVNGTNIPISKSGYTRLKDELKF